MSIEPRHLPRTLVIGHEPETHAALREFFDIVHIVADTPLAQSGWWDVHYLRAPLRQPTHAAMNDGTFNRVLKRYQRFSDINSRRFTTVNSPESEIYNSFVATFYWAHRVLTEARIEAVLLSNLPHEGFDYVVYLLARELGIRTIMTNQSMFPNRFWICDDADEFGNFSSAPDLHDLVPSGYRLPETWFYMSNASQNWYYGFGQFLREIARRPSRLPAAALRYHYSRRFRIDERRATYEPDPGERFIYVPLHLQPELTTSAVGGQDGRYADQAALLEQLSLWVPPDVTILVKENPKQTERQRGPLFYRRIDALPNVRFLRRTLPTRELIKQSLGIATVSGTAGWEAILLGKPTLLFGYAWYRQMRGVTSFSPEVSFADWQKNLPPSPEEIVAQLDRALIKAGYGIVDMAYAALVRDFDSVSNARQIAASLGKYWHERYHRPNQIEGEALGTGIENARA